MPHLATIYRLGVKELWSLARDPIMLVLIAFVVLAPEGILGLVDATRARLQRLGATIVGERVYRKRTLGEPPVKTQRQALHAGKGLARSGIVGGADISARYPSLGNALLVCATETRTLADIEAYAQALAETMRNSAAAA